MIAFTAMFVVYRFELIRKRIDELKQCKLDSQITEQNRKIGNIKHIMEFASYFSGSSILLSIIILTFCSPSKDMEYLNGLPFLGLVLTVAVSGASIVLIFKAYLQLMWKDE